MRRLAMRFAAGIGALTLVGTMAACANRPGTAATVGADRITVTQVDEMIAALPEELRTQSVVGHPSVVLNIEMRARAAQQVADDIGFEDLRVQAERSVDETPLPEEFRGDAAVRELLVSQEEALVLREHMGVLEMEEAFAEIPVTVNPRYGMTGLEELHQLRNTSLSLPAGSPE